jgi:pilus assembly protein CpaB
MIGVLIAVALAAAGTVVLVSYVRNAEDRALAGQETVDVLVVNAPISAGTPVDELNADTLRYEKVPRTTLTAGAVANLEAMEGMVVAVDLLPNEVLTSARLVAPQSFSERSTVVDVPEGYLEVTIAVEPPRALGGFITPGETVALLASFSSARVESGTITTEDGETVPVPPDLIDALTEAGATQTSGVLIHKVLITGVQVESRLVDDTTDDETGPELAPTSSLLITMALPAPEVERVVFSAEWGAIWFAREGDDAPEGGTRIQTGASIYDSPEPEAAPAP